MDINLQKRAFELKDELVEIRRDLHRHPELSFEETRTGDKIEEYLQELGIEVERGVGKTGLVGYLSGAEEGPTAALRGDIDALPIEEKNEVEYKSQNEGVMHACGHDVHTTSLLGAAKLLSEVRGELQGDVKFIFQPAEEINSGARAMMDDGVLKDPDVDCIFGLHTKPDIEAGKVGVKAGPMMAAVDVLEITVEGEGGHGAIPHETRDAIVAGSALVQNLQTVVSRRVSPFENVVVSIGKFNGGEAWNVIADRVEMKGTVRTFNPEVQKKLPDILTRIIENICDAHDTSGDLDYKFDLPALINDEKMSHCGKIAARKIVGEEKVISPEPTGGGEDFACFMQEVPGCFFFLGVRNEEEGIVHQWHHPEFDVDESSLPVGSGILAQSAVEALQES